MNMQTENIPNQGSMNLETGEPSKPKPPPLQSEKTKEQKKEEVKNEIAKYSEVQKLVFAAKTNFERTNAFQMDFAREANFAVQILESNAYLQKATPESIKTAIVNIALTGLTLNPALKFAYLVPRNHKEKGLQIILDIGYIGFIKLLTDAGSVKNIDADIICENDKYEFRKGSESYLNHQVSLTEKRGKPIGVYAIAYFRDGGNQFVIMTKEEVEKVRATSESWKKEDKRQYSPWQTWESEMWKKTAIRRLYKILPKTEMSDRLIAALGIDNDNELSDLTKEDRHAEIFDDIQEAEEIQ